jgi:hypothetical protein
MNFSAKNEGVDLNVAPALHMKRYSREYSKALLVGRVEVVPKPLNVRIGLGDDFSCKGANPFESGFGLRERVEGRTTKRSS